MKKYILMGGVFLFAFVLSASFTLAAKPAISPATMQFGPFTSDSPDSSTCGNDWANDIMDRFYKVDTKQNADGTYNITEEFKNGTFTTIAGSSPGACESGSNDGNTVPDGLTGKFQGSFEIVVSNGTFNPDATCTEKCYTSEFVSAFFGSGATYDVPTFLMHYNAKNNGEWKNASANRGGNHGDIYVDAKQTFTALDSSYYNGPTEASPLYGNGAISFVWDNNTGNVISGYYNEIVPPTTGTIYYNVVTSGTVSSGGAVSLTFNRTNPNNYGPFNFAGTLAGNILTGTLDGPYLFNATGTVTP